MFKPKPNSGRGMEPSRCGSVLDRIWNHTSDSLKEYIYIRPFRCQKLIYSAWAETWHMTSWDVRSKTNLIRKPSIHWKPRSQMFMGHCSFPVSIVPALSIYVIKTMVYKNEITCTAYWDPGVPYISSLSHISANISRVSSPTVLYTSIFKYQAWEDHVQVDFFNIFSSQNLLGFILPINSLI